MMAKRGSEQPEPDWHAFYTDSQSKLYHATEIIASALVSIRERMGLYEKDFGFTESMNLDNFNQYAKGPQWNRAYGNYESLMEMRGILEGK